MYDLRIKPGAEAKLMLGAAKHMLRDLEIKKIQQEKNGYNNEEPGSHYRESYLTILRSIAVSKELITKMDQSFKDPKDIMNDWRKYDFVYQNSFGHWNICLNPVFIAGHKNCVAIPKREDGKIIMPGEKIPYKG